MIPVCRFHNPRAACIALGKVARKKIGDASLRQFNRFESEETDWWLAPTKERPTFKYGKFLFDWCGDDSLLYGLYVEKGVDPSLKKFFDSARGRTYLMYEDWTWHQFLNDLKNHRIESVVQYVAREVHHRIVFRIDGGYVEDPKYFDPYKSLLKKSDHYLLHWEQTSQEFSIIKKDNKFNIFEGIDNVNNFDDLYELIFKINQDEKNYWLWLNFYIALELRNNNIDTILNKDKEEWTAEMIWDKFLKHFLPWFK